MAWYPGATKMELQPESDNQPAIKPTQFIAHSLAAPWTARRTYEYWRDSTNLESHFGLGYEGDLGQFIGTQTRADANAAANLRPDGTGAVSIETASNLHATDEWTAAQVEELIKLGVWMHTTHDVPLRLCRSASDPGFGYHAQFDAWNPNAHACPGAARVKQFKEVVLPGIVARANGQSPEEDPMPTPADYAKAVLTLDGVIAVPGAPASNPTWTLSSVATEILKRQDKALVTLAAQGATISELTKTVAALAANTAAIDPDALVARIQGAIDNVTIHLDTTP